MSNLFTPEQTMKRFGITKDQLKKQYKSNLEGLEKMLDKAKTSSKKVNGFTEAQLQDKVDQYQSIVKSL